jgi:catechol 2,3-dioxygenase-like lactoylglutathione lyase family enzyme
MTMDIEHIGLTVQSLDAAKRTLRDLLGFPIKMEKDLPQFGCNVAFFQAGGSVLEVIEWYDKSVLNGQTGLIDHLAIKVEDIGKVVRQMKTEGVRFEAEELGIAVRTGERFWYIYTQAESTFGIRFQLVEQIPAEDTPKPVISA